MTNKQTIDGVSRELLEIYTGRKEGDWVEAGHELRALLDKPECCTCNGVGHIPDGVITSSGGVEFENGPVECVKDCPDCSKQAAQPQGEVERLRDLNRDAMADLNDRKREIYGLRAQLNKRDATSAEPNPRGEVVAFVDEDDDGIFVELIYGENGNPLRCGDKLYAEQPAPVAVVMPERKTKADYSGYIEQFQSEAAGLYNSALDDVAKLNWLKP